MGGRMGRGLVSRPSLGRCVCDHVCAVQIWVSLLLWVSLTLPGVAMCVPTNQNNVGGDSLVVQWLWLFDPTAGGGGHKSEPWSGG